MTAGEPPAFGSAARLDDATSRDLGLPDGEARPRVVAAEQARRVIDGLRLSTVSAERLERVGALLAEAADLLDEERHGGPYAQSALDVELGRFPTGDDPHVTFPFSPIVGWLNPLAVPATWATVEGGVRGRVRFPVAYNGPPDMVHGGVIALLFDELLGGAILALGIGGGFTGTLSVRYVRPTPILADLDLWARVDQVDGRKLFASGELSHDGEVCARAEGVFIRPAAPIG